MEGLDLLEKDRTGSFIENCSVWSVSAVSRFEEWNQKRVVTLQLQRLTVVLTLHNPHVR